MVKSVSSIRFKMLFFIAVILFLFIVTAGMLMSSLLMAQKEYSFFLDHFAVKNEAIQNLGYMILGSVKAENSYLLHLRSEDKEDFYEKISSAKDNVRELEDLEQLIQEKVGADENGPEYAESDRQHDHQL